MLISVAELATRIGDPDLVVVDCRFSLADTEQGYREYQNGHLPNAHYAHLDRDLAGPITATTGRHPLPEPQTFQHTLRSWGISNDTQVVAYDDAGGAIAARLWWMLRWLGHDAVAVLNGGYPAWIAAKRDVSTEPPAPAAGSFRGEARAEYILEIDELDALLKGEPEFALVDARDAGRFRGEVEPIDPVAGHVPGAVNAPFSQFLDREGRWLAVGDVKNAWRRVFPEGPPTPWAVMCGSGVTACHLALAAAVAGLPTPRLYVGSWSQWLKEPARGVATDT